jgi:hypothetical protein
VKVVTTSTATAGTNNFPAHSPPLQQTITTRHRPNCCGCQPPLTLLVRQRCDTLRRGHSLTEPSIVDFPACIQTQNLMTSRVTRSAARRSAGSANDNSPHPQPPPPPPPAPSRPPPASTRKRKAAQRDSSPEQPPEPAEAPPARSGRAKRTKVDAPAAPAHSKKAKGKAAMSSPEFVPEAWEKATD